MRGVEQARRTTRDLAEARGAASDLGGQFVGGQRRVGLCTREPQRIGQLGEPVGRQGQPQRRVAQLRHEVWVLADVEQPFGGAQQVVLQVHRQGRSALQRRDRRGKGHEVLRRRLGLRWGESFERQHAAVAAEHTVVLGASGALAVHPAFDQFVLRFAGHHLPDFGGDQGGGPQQSEQPVGRVARVVVVRGEAFRCLREPGPRMARGPALRRRLLRNSGGEEQQGEGGAVHGGRHPGSVDSCWPPRESATVGRTPRGHSLDSQPLVFGRLTQPTVANE